MQYPQLPTFAFIAAFLVLIPLPSHWRARNVATLALIFWLFFADIIYAINSIVWAGNIIDHDPIWCDISTKFTFGMSFALPLCTICICKHLELVSSSRKHSYTHNDRRRRMIFEGVLCFIVPLIFMILHYIVQGHRYDIIENLGCQAAIYASLPAVFIIWFPQLLFAFITFIYGALAINNFLRHRLIFSANLSNSHALTPNRYLRLISMALAEILWGTTLTAYNLYISVSNGLMPYKSWTQVHSHFERIHVYPTVFFPENYVRIMMLFWWSIPVSSIIFFVFFGFGEEAMKEYKRFWSRVKNIVFWRRNRLEKQKQTQFGSFSPSRPQLKIISVKWPPSTSFSESKSPTSMVSQSTLIPGALESGNFKRSKSFDFGTFSEKQEFPIPTYYESTWGAEKATTEKFSPTSSTHPTLIGQVIDPKRKDKVPHRHLQTDDDSALPDIDESDAFTIDSFTHYEGLRTSTRLSASLFPSPTHSTTVSTPRKPIPTFSPPTPPHPPSPKFAFMQHSLPPPPARKQPRAIGSLTSLLRLGTNVDEVDERGRFSRGDFSFHHVNDDNSGTGPRPYHAYPRSPVQYGTQSSRNVRSVRALIMQDVPEDVGPRSYTRSLGDLVDLPERQELTIGLEPLKRKDGGV